MSNLLVCPHCSKTLDISDELLNEKELKCVYCATEFENPFSNRDSTEVKSALPVNKNYIKTIIILALLGMAGYTYYYHSSSNASESKSHSPSANRDSRIRFLKRDAKYDHYTNSITINCQVSNGTGKLITYMDVKAIFYDKRKNIMGVGFGNLSNIPDGYIKVISIIGLDVDNAESYELELNNVIYSTDIDAKDVLGTIH